MKTIKRYLILLISVLILTAVPFMAYAAKSDLSVTGSVIEIEKFGHAVLDITAEDFNNAGFRLGDIVTVTTEHYSGDMPYFNGYYVDKGEYMLRADPRHTTIAVCINYGNFAEVAGLKVGDTVTITLKEAAGALMQQEMNNLVYSNNRADYSLDTVFANFRPAEAGNIAEGTLYRSASPADNVFGRAAYANELAELVRVGAVMNLADSDEELREHFSETGFCSYYYQKLYQSGRVIPLGLPIDFDSAEFGQGIARGLTFLSEQNPPYLVHCTEGKDRAGFASMVLEALMGASVEEIIADYMKSYENYFGILPGTEKYNYIVEKNILPMLTVVTGGADPKSVNLSDATEAYLLVSGMKPEAISVLRWKLSGH